MCNLRFAACPLYCIINRIDRHRVVSNFTYFYYDKTQLNIQ